MTRGLKTIGFFPLFTTNINLQKSRFLVVILGFFRHVTYSTLKQWGTSCSNSQWSKSYDTNTYKKQPSRCVLRKRCSKNMQPIYRRTPIPKCDFNKVALHWCYFGLLLTHTIHIKTHTETDTNTSVYFTRKNICI